MNKTTVDKEKWEKEFEENFTYEDPDPLSNGRFWKKGYLPETIKSFISKVEAKAHQAGRDEVLKEVKDIILPLGIKSKISIDVFRHLSEKLQSLEQKEKE